MSLSPGLNLEEMQELAKRYSLELNESESMPSLLVPAQEILTLVSRLKKEEGLDYLRCISGVHLAEQVENSAEDVAEDEKMQLLHKGFEVVYHLSSLEKNNLVALKVVLGENENNLPSIDSLYDSANWFEREVFDLFGVIFDNSKNLSRIMLPPDWRGHPMRKDYKEESEYNGMPTTRESELLQRRLV